jgi:UDP-glucose 6-dehydrogenase
MKVTVIGVGYVGLTIALTLAYLGHEVIGVDQDAGKIELLTKRKTRFTKPALNYCSMTSRKTSGLLKKSSIQLANPRSS